MKVHEYHKILSVETKGMSDAEFVATAKYRCEIMIPNTFGGAWLSEALRRLEKPLRLFVWDQYCLGYDYGLAFAIAEDETQARALIMKQNGDDDAFGPGPKIYELNEPIAFERPGGG